VEKQILDRYLQLYLVSYLEVHPHMKLKIIAAGAGSGKTYRLTQELVDLLRTGVRADRVIATTFTRKAAAELQERVRIRLLEEGLHEQAEALTNALIGTVHGLGVKLLRRFAYEAGVSPEVSIIAEEDQQALFNHSLANVTTEERVQEMDRLSERLGLEELNQQTKYDWRHDVRRLTEVARANDFSAETLEYSKEKSYRSFAAFLDAPDQRNTEEWQQNLKALLLQTQHALQQNEDSTQATAKVKKQIAGSLRQIERGFRLNWSDWARLSKIKPGAKSREVVADLQAFAASHDRHPGFHQDIRQFISALFDLTIAAIQEFGAYKKQRGLIDYTDMEVLVKGLLDNAQVQEVLSHELDLLMVDEFQDTSPIQLEIFLKLSRFAAQSIWVGDPKQSIYGFRGAAPELMQAIIRENGGIDPDNILGFSWRSRQDIVHATNAIFDKAFEDLPTDRIALRPKRTTEGHPDGLNREAEPIEMDNALPHWHMVFDDEGASRKKTPGKPWMENAIATSLAAALQRGLLILPKGSSTYRNARPGDVAILCRSNRNCRELGEALQKQGLKVSIAQAELLQTAEAKLILACLKYLLNPNDSLSVAELLLLGAGEDIEDIIDHRLSFLEQEERRQRWATEYDFISSLDELREQIPELSPAEMLDVLLSSMDLRRLIVAWGNQQQRFDNVDVLRKYSRQYEEACMRMHTAASLGGFLLWLDALEKDNQDMQGSGEDPNAVNVLTYHRSKGLEWPVVICHSLDGNLRSDIWGLDIVQESETIDLNNLLGSRWLRFWVNPYGKQFRGTVVQQRIEDSPTQREKTMQARAEEARLLYVGITRARDYLVIPSSAKPTRWLNRVWHQGQEDFPTLDPDTYETPWAWGDHLLNKSTEVFYYPRDFTEVTSVPGKVTYWEKAAGPKAHPFEQIDLRQESFEDQFKFQSRERQLYIPQLDLEQVEDPYLLGKAAKAYLTAYRGSYSSTLQHNMAEGLLQNFDLQDSGIEADLIVTLAQRWEAWMELHFQPLQRFRKVPIRYQHTGRWFESVIDVLLETEQEYVLVQHSGFSGPQKKLRSKAQELSSWFYLSSQAVKKFYTAPKPTRTFVNFVLHGMVFELMVKPQKAKMSLFD